VQTGDRFQPYGMKGTRLVSDYLTDRKRTLFEKRRQLVVTDAQGEILWLVGERVAHCYAVTDATRSILRLSFASTAQS
jgi:tRNA(Ile)-lysidine synthase